MSGFFSFYFIGMFVYAWVPYFFKIIKVLNSCEYNLVQVVYHRVHFLLLLQFNKASPGWWMAFLYSELTFRDSGSFSFFDFTIP